MKYRQASSRQNYVAAPTERESSVGRSRSSQMRRGAKPLSVDPGFVAAEARKADERRARFAALESAPAPPILKKTVAWPGGKILTPNKAEAISSFLERKKGDLSPEHEQALRGHLDRAAFSASEVRVGPGALAGLTLAMSAGGDESGTSQADLARSIREAGGIVSNTVHKNVHLLIASTCRHPLAPHPPRSRNVATRSARARVRPLRASARHMASADRPPLGLASFRPLSGDVTKIQA